MRFHLRVSTRFLASPEDVWALKTDPESLRQEFLPWLHLSVRDPVGLAAALQGRRILPFTADARVWALPWPIEITERQSGSRYRDRSNNALFEDWEHEHVVEPASDATRYLDAVTFTPRWGPPLLVARLVEALFVHRHRRAALRLPAEERSTGVSMLRELLDLRSDGQEGYL